jgi:hypothetical protein
MIIVYAEMSIQSEKYHAYLLRLWLVEQNEKPVWRASLENVHTAECRGFASLEALIFFLLEEEKTGRHGFRHIAER